MKMKRVLALILSSVMICTAVPGEVMAAEIELESEGEFSDEVEELTEPEEEIPSEAVDEVELQNEELDETQALEFENNASGENLFTDEKTEEKNVLAKGETGGGEWILYDDGDFVINGTYVSGYSRGNAPWYRYHNQIKKIVVEDGINRIGNAAFYGCDNVLEVDIANTVTSIEFDAFRNCTKLQAIILPRNLTKMGDCVFRDCKSLEKVEIPESLTSIPERTFMGCSSLENIKLPKSIKVIGDSIFENCSNLRQIHLPEGIDRIPVSAFYNCKKLYGVYIPYSVERIETNAFGDCESLVNVQIPKGVKYIESVAFDGCKSLKIVEILGNLKQIETNAFLSCGKLEIIRYGGSFEEWTKFEVSVNDDVGIYCNYKMYHSHVYEPKIITTATCIENGVVKNICKLCGDNYTEEIKATGHKEVKDAAVAATCEKAGKSEGSHCSVCGKVIKAQKEVPALGHSWDTRKVTKVATCTEAGVKTYTCTRCQKTKTEEIKATGHKEVKDAAVAATCEKAGKTEGSHCSVCGKVIKAQKEVPALGHSWNSGKITKAATCTETGVKTYTCTRCQKTKTEEIKATGHKEVKDAAVSATCEKAGKTEGSHCSVCNKVIKAQKEVPALGHNWDTGKITKAATCTEAGVKTYTCTRCQKTKTEEIKATGHKEVKDAAVSATCEKAGKTEGSHCSVCNKVIKAQKEVPALGHNWDTGKITKAATCTETGIKTYTCTRCKKTKTEEIKATGHKEVKDAAVAATCEKAGKSEGSHCSVCGKVIKAQKEVPALGHSWNSGKVTKAATCTEAGVKTYTCTRCKKTKTEEIKATGHKFSAWKTSSKATIYSPAKQTRECTSCHKKQTRDIGKKLKATIKVSASKITMQPQQKLGTLKVTFANGDSVKSWKSSNPNIFKVVGKTNGKCTLTAGRIAGTAKLTIKLKSGLTKDVSITVKSVKTTKISGVKSAITLKVKKTTTLKPVLAPKNSTEKITYKSSDSKIVTVNAAGKVVAKKKGTAYIYVKSGSKTATCKIVVK